MVKVKVLKRGGKGRDDKVIAEFDKAESTKLDEVKKLVTASSRISSTRQRLTFADGVNAGKPLSGVTLSDCGIADKSAGVVTLYVKDLGPQISWRLVFLIEYFGPILLFSLFYFFPKLVYGIEAPKKRVLAQQLAFGLTVLHYAKREIETLVVHRFSNATMPISRLPINCAHYWVLFGIAVGYYTMHPKFQAPNCSDVTLYGLAGLMIVFEFMNGMTHLVLRDLRPPGTKTRGIPKGYGFEMTSCANYFWETCAWLAFCGIVRTFTSWCFLVVAFLQMAEWAHKKHRRYKADFKDYPTSRTAIIPFIA